MRKHIISLLVSNRPGVLIRIALVFAKRAYNIDSLITHPMHNKDFSIINITATGEERVLSQIIKQLNKLVDVVHVADTSNVPSVQLELGLMKIKFEEEARADLLHIAHSLDCDIVDVSANSLIISYVGDEQRLTAIQGILDPYGIIEIIRTGTLLMVRGEGATV